MLVCTLFHFSPLLIYVILLSFINIAKPSLLLVFIIPRYNLQLAFLFLYLGSSVLKNVVLSFVWISSQPHAISRLVIRSLRELLSSPLSLASTLSKHFLHLHSIKRGCWHIGVNKPQELPPCSSLFWFHLCDLTDSKLIHWINENSRAGEFRRSMIFVCGLLPPQT